MLELLFLLLPLAVLYGWYVGYRKAYQDFDRAESTRSQKIVSGVRFLLENKKTKASEYLVDLLNEDSDNYEAHLALAEVYRNRGDFDRAIKLHEELLSSADLPMMKSEVASYELAKDFIAVSLYDKAIKLLKVPVCDPDLQVKYLKLLIKTYQRLGDWDDALNLITANRSVLADKYTSMLYAQFLCEKAQNFLLGGDSEKGEKLINQALDANPLCIRALIMESELLSNRGKCPEAKALLEQIISHRPDMALIALTALRKCFVLPQETPEYMETLSLWIRKTTSSEVIIEYASMLLKNDVPAAKELIIKAIQDHPSLKLFGELLNLQILSTRDNESRENMGLILSLVHAEESSRSTYTCVNCGFSSRIMFWRCPSCGEWETFHPVTGFEGD